MTRTNLKGYKNQWSIYSTYCTIITNKVLEFEHAIHQTTCIWSALDVTGFHYLKYFHHLKYHCLISFEKKP